jgi:hypothetical protein
MNSPASENPGGQKALTRAAYDALCPRDQGYASYMQGAWNPEVPEECPYPEGSTERTSWDAGQMAAVTVVQDMEE